MAIGDINTIEAGTSKDSHFKSTQESKKLKKLNKILVISKNSSDIYMVKKYLPKSDGYKIHEASTASAALKVMHYLNLDLIIVDDKLDDIDGYEMIEKLNHMDIVKDIPKILLLTQDYKTEKKESFVCANLDYVKKPLDKVIFRIRVKHLIENSKQGYAKKSYFKQLSVKKIEEAQEYLTIYQDIFEYGEDIMCLYDSQCGEIVESNQKFEKFFLNLTLFNRIISNPRLARKFVPVMEEANYLNYYAPEEWMQTLIASCDFNYLVKLQRDYKEYSFNIAVKKLVLLNRDVYLIKLSNIYDYLPKKSHKKVDSSLVLKEKNLASFKDDFIALRDNLRLQNIENPTIEKNLYQLSTKLSILCDDVSIVQDFKKEKQVNLFFTIAQLLKEKFVNKHIYLNNYKVDTLFDENSEEIIVSLDVNLILETIEGILNNYYSGVFSDESRAKRVDISVVKNETELALELKIEEERATNHSLTQRIFSKSSENDLGERDETLPKRIKQSLTQLKATINKYDENGVQIFKIVIPL